MKKGCLFVICAASGTGKTSLVKALLESVTNLEVSISHTTRPPRPGEKDGSDYFFVSQETFNQYVGSGEFLEHAVVFHHHYGTLRKKIDEKLSNGTDIILEIDWQGARQVREIFKNCTTVFILPPSLECLQMRLNKRAQDSIEVIEERLNASMLEISHYHEFDYNVINDCFETALRDLQSIVLSQRCLRRFHFAEFDHYVKNLAHNKIKV